jgi:hypothetical protein
MTHCTHCQSPDLQPIPAASATVLYYYCRSCHKPVIVAKGGQA